MSGFEGFGLVTIKTEGGTIHPDDLHPNITDEKYMEQLKGYIDETGHKDCFCCRPNLLEKVLNNG